MCRNKKRVGELLSKTLSVVLHPLVLPTYGAAAMLYGPTYLSILPPHLKLYIFGVFVLTTFLLPFFFIQLLHTLKFIPTPSEQPHHRNFLPTLMAVTGYVICNYFIRNYIAIGLLPYLLLGGIGIALVCFAVNLRWRISLHMAAIGGLAALMLSITWQGYGQMIFIFLIFILLAGLLGTSRLYLGENNLRQISAGFMIGIAVMLLITNLL